MIPSNIFRRFAVVLFLAVTVSVLVTVLLYETSLSKEILPAPVFKIDTVNMVKHQQRIDSLQYAIDVRDMRIQEMQESIDLLIVAKSENNKQYEKELKEIRYISDSARLVNVAKFLGDSAILLKSDSSQR